MPVERSSHSITAVGDKLFLFGGEHDPRVPIGSDVFVYDLGNSTWSVLQTSGTPPSPRVAHAAAAIGSNLWFYGGRRGVAMGEGALGDLFVLDTMTGAWTSLPTQGTAPPDRSYHAMTAAGAKLYVFGGASGMGFRYEAGNRGMRYGVMGWGMGAGSCRGHGAHVSGTFSAHEVHQRKKEPHWTRTQHCDVTQAKCDSSQAVRWQLAMACTYPPRCNCA